MKKLYAALFCSLPLVTYAQATHYEFGAVVAQYRHNQSSQDRVKAYQNLAKQLADTLKQPVKFIPFHSYHALVTGLKHDKINFAYYKASDFILAQTLHYNFHPLTTVLTKSERGITDTYSSLILTKGKELTTLASLKGKSFGLNKSHMSNSGLIYPLAYFHKNKINPSTYFSQIKFYEGSYEALTALSSHKVTAAAVWDDSYYLNKTNQSYSIIANLAGIPNPLFVSSGELSTTQRQQLEKAMLKLPASAYKGLTFVGVELYKASLYAANRALFQQVRQWYPRIFNRVKHAELNGPTPDIKT